MNLIHKLEKVDYGIKLTISIMNVIVIIEVLLTLFTLKTLMKNLYLYLCLVVVCLLSSVSVVQAAQFENPHVDFMEGVKNISSAKITAENSVFLYRNKKLVLGSVAQSKGAAVKVGSTTYDSISFVTTSAGDDKESLETKMDFIRKGEFIFIKFKYGPAKNKWIKMRADQYEAFGESLELTNEFEMADISDPGGGDTALMMKLAKLAEKHNLYVNFEDPVTKKKKGKTLTTYTLEYDRKAVVPFYTEMETILTDEEKEKTIIGIPGFSAAIKSKFFVDTFVENSYVRLVFNEVTGEPVEYIAELNVPEHKSLSFAIEHFVYMKMDDINKKVKVVPPSKFITTDAALKLMGLED